VTTSVRSDRRHRFDADPAALWAALADVGSYRAWWPWLTTFEGATFAPGARWRCEIRPPLPYVLRFDLLLEEVEAPRFVTARVEGDLVGDAAIDVTAVDGGSELRLVSVLAPAGRVAGVVATLAPAAVRFGHDWVLDTGLRQFRARALTPGRAPGDRGPAG
jgi:hypothetical protein